MLNYDAEQIPAPRQPLRPDGPAHAPPGAQRRIIGSQWVQTPRHGDPVSAQFLYSKQRPVLTEIVYRYQMVCDSSHATRTSRSSGRPSCWS
jgi:hypothetical protein